MLLSVGGGGRSDGFAKVAKTQAKRRKFAEELVALTQVYDLDGIDFNNEA